MRHCFLTILLLLAALPLAAQDISTTSAASFFRSVSPDSLASIFGQNLASLTIVATLDENGDLPLELDGTRVEIDGRPARLIFVSPGQINCLVPPGTAQGVVEVVVSTRFGSTLRGTVQVLAAAPGIFSNDASGAGPGAVLNGVTFDREPFLVETPENRGDDKRTRLSVFGTGFRSADQLFAEANIDGATHQLEVEFFGATPDFFGLDQANLVLEAELDFADIASLTLTTATLRSNTVTIELDSLPADRLRLSSLTMLDTTVTGGRDARGRLRLNGRAATTGATVFVSSGSPLVTPPSQVLVRSGDVSADFTMGTAVPASTTTVTLTATFGGASEAAQLTLRRFSDVEVLSVTLSPDTLLGGSTTTGTVNLTDTVASGSLDVTLASDSDLAQTPESVTILAGQRSANFLIRTTPVSTEALVTITATGGGLSQSAQLRIRPPISLSIDPNVVQAGGTVVATVALAEPAPATGTTVQLSSSHPSATVPAFVTVPVGLTEATFFVTTNNLPFDQTAIIRATYSGSTASADLVIESASGAMLDSISVNPTVVVGGTPVTGVVSLTRPAPAGGIRVTFRSSSPLLAPAPAAVTIQAGFQTQQVLIQTSSVVFTIDITITATAGGISRTATLRLNP